MLKTTVAALGGLVLMAGSAFAYPPPNDVGVTSMGGGAYYNPYVARGDTAGPVNGVHGATDENNGAYHPVISRHG
jgi:hypothetical protein